MTIDTCCKPSKPKCETLQDTWRPRRVVCDFEQVLIAAVETEFCHTQISGCYFHFCQNLWWKVQNLGLAADYWRHRRLKKCIRKVMAIGYLPLAVVRQNLQLLRTSRSTVRLCSRHHELQDFLNYCGPITVLRVSITSVFAFITKPVIIIIRMFAAKIQKK